MAESARNLNLDWALYYRGLGWSVIPIKPGSKLPAIAWAEYSHRLPTTDEIRTWWTGAFQNCGVGLVTGIVSGVFALDVDDNEFKNAYGSEALAGLETAHGPLPATTEAKTGSGGRHLLFRHPGLGIKVKTTKNLGSPHGLDVRGDGGFIVVAPSIHPNGNIYAWSVDAGPEQVAPADPPDWLVGLVEDGADADIPRTSAPDSEYTRNKGPLGLDGDQVNDGRESYMRDTVLACLGQYIGENGAVPSPQELFDIAWPQYAAKVDFTRPGRREAEMRDKCARAIRRFEQGQIRGMRSLEEAVVRWQAKSRAKAPEPPGSAQQAPGEAASDVFDLLSLSDLETLPPASWLVDRWVPEGGFSIMYGPSRSLKSFIALDLLLHIATGRQWHGHLTKAGPVLYICGEGYAGIAKRVRAWRQHYGADTDAPFRMTRHAVAFDDPQMVEKLIRTIQAAQAAAGHAFAAICVDTVARAFGAGDENATKDMNRFITACDRIRAVTGAAVLGVHHTGKDKERGMRGSSSLPGAMDSTIKVERIESVVTITNEKQKDDEEAPPKTFKTHKVEWQQGIKPVSSLVLLDAEASAAPRARFISKQQRRILDLLIEAIVREGRHAPASDHIPASAKGVSLQLWKDYVRAGVVAESDNPETAQKAFKRASDILISDGYVGKWQDFVWVIDKSDNRT